MLTLDGLFRVGTFTVYRDVMYRDGQRSFTTKFYVLPDAPRLARDDSGGPAFRFLWYRWLDQAVTGAPNAVAGGMLTVTVELGPDPKEQAHLRSTIAAIAGLDNPDAIELLPVLFKSGEVSVSFAAETAGGDFAAKVGGNGPAALTGPERATFAVELTKDGAALLAKALNEGLDVLSVHYDLVFEYRLDAIKLRVWCDLQAASQEVSSRLAAGALSPGQLREMLEASSRAGIEISTETEILPDQRVQLQQMASHLLETMLTSAMFTFDDGAPADTSEAQGFVAEGKVGRLRPLTDTVSLNHTFTESYPAEQRVGLNAVVGLKCAPEELAARLLQVDVSGAMKALEVTVVCPVDFAGGLIGAVHVWIDYNAKAADGSTIDQSADFLFKQGATQWVFRANATPEQRSYRHRATAFYKDGTTADLDETASDATVLVIDVNAIGVLDVTATLGDVPMSAVKNAVVELEYPPKGLKTTLVLDGTTSAQNWQAVVGQRDLAPYRYRVTWLTVDGRRVEDDWREAAACQLILDAPRGLGATATVEAIAAGDFSQLAQLILELRAAPAADVASVQHTFTRAGESFTWKRHAAALTAISYQARRTMVYQDGTVQVLDWTDESTPVLVVRDVLRFAVQIVPRLLDLGGTWTIAVLDLDYADEAALLHTQDSLVLHDKTADAQWSFRVASPDRHRYRYRLTLVGKDGAKHDNPWQETENEVLVLQP